MRGKLLVTVTLLVSLGIATLLKLHYRSADAEALRWVLAPTRGLVELLTHAHFELEPHQGYLDRDRLFVIAPECAGVNFLVVVFLSLVLGSCTPTRSMRSQVRLVVGSLLTAYVVTLAANATRIALAMQMHAAGLHGMLLSPERLHRIEGVVVHFVFLLATFLVAQRPVTHHALP